ncbi:MAG: DNA polymerase III subunit alpha [Erysipelotrichaceae bacterium]|nr:DNA polymerase III subunit alpha [Erysipelotrichaceae bacterium]
MITSLYNKSAYSLLDSLNDIGRLVYQAKKMGYHNLAICDDNCLTGANILKKECQKYGIKPIYGLEFLLHYNDDKIHVCLYAKNDVGFHNLIKLSTYLNTVNLYLNQNELNEYLTGNILIFLSDDLPFYQDILNDDHEKIIDGFIELKKYYPDFYIGLTKGYSLVDKKQHQLIKECIKGLGIKTLAFDKSSFLNKDDAEALKVLKAIKEKTTVNNKDLIDNEYEYFKASDLLTEYYDREDLMMCDFIGSMCNVELYGLKTKLPKYIIDNNYKSKDYLIALCKTGLKLRLNNKLSDKYVKRLKYELEIITRMNFEDYFLIVYDFIKYAKKNGVNVGPGRGSAAGSLVAYSLGITEIDPIKYDLLFERFLNPDRISMPDIDIDFPDNRRDEIIDYVSEKYGYDHVAHIITFGTLKAKQVIRDVGRALDIPAYDVDRLAKAVPNIINITLKKAYESSKVFNELINAKREYRHLFDICLRLEGLPRHMSTHAAGIVFSDAKMSDVVPLIKIEDTLLSTQYQMEFLEDYGLIKMDFLGLRNLSIIQEIVDDLRQDEPDFRLYDIPLDDEKTFKIIDEVKTLGIFQLESSGMQSVLRRIVPKNFEDIALTIALFRPGPMENIDLFLKNRNNVQGIKYLHSDLIPILKSTAGIIVYQEQIMQIAQKMANFTLSKADILRKAMSKKRKEELLSLQNDFIEGCVNNGYERASAVSIYDLILEFANYGFNKSHSIAYALIAYQMAYLKANYPYYFYKALLNGAKGSDGKTYEYLTECKEMGIELFKPDINRSAIDYLVENKGIRLPLSIIKNIGGLTAVKIINERKRKGRFKDYIDAVCRLRLHDCNNKALEMLINAGAFDSFNLTRTTYLNNLDSVIKYALHGYQEEDGILNDEIRPAIKRHADERKILASKEKEALGFCFSINPIMEIKAKYNIRTQSLSTIKHLNAHVYGFGVIDRIKTHVTKNGQYMAFLDISDETANISLVLMPNVYRQCQNQITKGSYISFNGKIEKEDSVLVQRVEIFNE